MSTFNVGDLAYSLENVLLKRKDINFLLRGMRGSQMAVTTSSAAGAWKG